MFGNTFLRPRSRYLRQRQSKSGCITCKKRKVKCDEQHPICQRCTSRQIVCAGYTSTSDASKHLGPGQATTSTVEIYRQRVTQALTSLSQHEAGLLCLTNIIEQVTPIASSEFALEIIELMDTGDTFQASQLYATALQKLHNDLEDADVGKLPLLVSCCLMAVIELRQHRRRNALVHLIGSYAMPLADLSNSATHSVQDLRLCLNLQMLIYSAGVRRSLLSAEEMVYEASATYVENLSPGQVRQAQVMCKLNQIHTYIAQTHYDALLGIDICTSNNVLRHWLEECRNLVHDIRTDVRLEIVASLSHATLYVQLNLCLMTALVLKQLHAVNETSWDQFRSDFAEIVDNAELVLTTQLPKPMSGAGFTILIGVIAPLYFVALKCRDAILRRRAVARLDIAGSEGPFNGKDLAAVARRCMEHEEFELSHHPDPHHIPIIPEQRRVVKVYTMAENGDSASRSGMRIKMLCRRQPCSALNAIMLASSHFASSPMFEDLRAKKSLDRNYWAEWTEILEFNADTP